MSGSTKIIENGFVFTGDKQNRAGQIALLIQNGIFADLGKPAQVLKALYPSAEVIDAKGKVILPGFIDAHHTGESFTLRYLTSSQPLSKWSKNPQINSAIEYFHKNATYEEFLSLYRLSYYAALKSGVTTLSEYGCDNPEHSFPAAVEAMQQTSIKGFIGLHNGDQIEAAQKAHLANIKFAAVIADEENLTTYNLQSTIRAANDFQWPIILHIGQTKRASDVIKKNFNKTIAQLYAEYHLFDYPVHLLHLIVFDENDWEIIAKSGAPLILSPSAILNKGTDLPPFAELLKRKMPVALGTDWGVSNPLENVQAYCLILKTLGLPVERAFDLLALQTKNGAKALGLESEIGTIETGKKADLVFIDLSDIRMNNTLVNNSAEKILELTLQYSSSKYISDVMINGEFYVREGHLLTYSEEELALEGEKLLKKLLTFGEQTNVSALPTAAILQFSKQQRNESDLPFEEGFRIVKKEDSTRSSKSKVENLKNNQSKLPENVKKIFGEDDL